MQNVLSINDLHYKYPLGGEIFSGANLEIKKGEFSILLGKNGCGKSTLINLLLGHRTPLEGKITILGLDPVKDKIDIRKKMFYMSHLIEHEKHASIAFLLNITKLLYPNYSEEKEKELMDIFELDRDTCINELSLGQACRVQIIAGISSNAELLIIDEITAVLDPLCRKDFTDILIKEAREGKSILMATNIPGDSETKADNVYGIKNKEIMTYE